MNHLFPTVAQMPVLLAAAVPVETLAMIGAAVAVVVTVFTFSNWRLGVKIAFVMLLFEGAIRKWLIPGAQELAYFAKDIFLIGAYCRFFFSPDMEIRSWKVRAPAGLIILCCGLLSFSALNPNIGSVVLGLYGIKIYVFYIPLAFMIPYLFRSQEEMVNNLFWYAMLATPICLLGIVQFAAPGYASINVIATGEEGTGFGWSEARIRVTGTFSYITGFTTFIAVFFSLHLALLMTKLPKWKWWLLAANMPLIFGNALMSGSRGTVLMMLLVGAAFITIGIFYQLGTGGNKVLIMAAIVGLTALVVGVAFREAKEQWSARMFQSGENIAYRVIGMPLGSMEYGIKAGGFFGLGIGMTHPAVERLRNVMRLPRPKTLAPVFDTEIGQVFVELGMVGWLSWYGMRLMMLVQSWFLFSRAPPGPLKPLLLASVMVQAPHMLFSIMLNHTANFLVFACYGLSLIATLHPAVGRTTALRGRNVRDPALPNPAGGGIPEPLPSGPSGSKYSPPIRQR